MITASIISSIIAAIASAFVALSVVDSTGGQISAAIKQKDNQETIKRLSEEIAKDQKLARQLVEGFNRKGADYANAILNRSPFGTAFNKLNKAITNNARDLKEATDLEIEINSKANDAMTKAQNMPTGSGSIIGDLVAGGTKQPNYENSQTKLENLKERL